MPDEKTRPTTNGYNPTRWKPVPLNPSRKLWFRQPKESVQAYEAFMIYLTLPIEDRSMRRAAEIVGKSHSVMMKWASRWSWTHRVAAYEEHYLMLRLESVEADRDAMWVEQKALADMGMNIVGAHFEDLIAAIDQNTGRANVIKPDALVRLFDTATKVQRMAILGRAKSTEEVQERNERLAEAYAEELVDLIREVQGEIGLTPEQEEKMQNVLKRHLVGAGEEKDK